MTRTEFETHKIEMDRKRIEFKTIWEPMEAKLKAGGVTQTGLAIMQMLVWNEWRSRPEATT